MIRMLTGMLARSVIGSYFWGLILGQIFNGVCMGETNFCNELFHHALVVFATLYLNNC